jgi:hypothetical protein
MQTNDFFDQCLSLRSASMQEIQERFSISKEKIDRDANYMKLTSLTEFHNPDTHPGYFYFKDDEFVLLYVGYGPELEQLDPQELQERLGGVGVELRSRVGKHFVHHVYPKAGIAFSTDDDIVQILEVFPSTSLDAYLSDIYEEPLPFYK